MKQQDLDNYINIFTRARIAGEQSNDGEDGGSCNLDAVTVKIPRIPEKSMQAILMGSNLTGYKMSSSFWRGRYSIGLTIGTGQGNRNVRVCQAVEKSLEADGIDTFMYQRMD